MIVWWKIENLLLSFNQLVETGMWKPDGEHRQLRLWIGNP